MSGVRNRKFWWVISLLLATLYFSNSPAQAQYGGGSGEPNDPYLIYTAEQMNEVGLHEEDWDKHFEVANIDLYIFLQAAIIEFFPLWEDCLTECYSLGGWCNL